MPETSSVRATPIRGRPAGAWRAAVTLGVTGGVTIGVVLLAAALVGPLLLQRWRAPPGGAAPVTWQVEVGTTLPLGVLPALVGDAAAQARPLATEDTEGTGGTVSLHAFFPDPLTIHVGDTVNWTFVAAERHTVTFNGGEPDLPDLVPGPGPGEVTLGPAFLPLGPTAQHPAYDGTTRASSGIPTGAPEGFTFRLTFTRPGAYGYVCTVHDGMRGSIDVVPREVALREGPDETTARGRGTRGGLLGKISDVLQEVHGAAVGPLHTVTAGVSNGFGVTALAFLPGSLTVHQGDLVVWTVTDTFETHTITVSPDPPPGVYFAPRAGPQGAPLLVIPATIASPVGGPTYRGQGAVNSGLLTPGNSFVLVFDAPPQTYQYYCSLHPQMRGTITAIP